jgi:hypothetical protein
MLTYADVFRQEELDAYDTRQMELTYADVC